MGCWKPSRKSRGLSWKNKDRCSFCKGNLYEGKTEFVAKVGDEVISIKEVPAYVCENCGEAYYTPEILRKIDRQSYA